MEKLYFIVGWEYWDKHGYNKITHIFSDENERNKMRDNLCPVVHEYPFDCNKFYTDEQIAELLNKKEYVVHL